MKLIQASFYYVPICTESLASIDRLKSFFAQLKDTIRFEIINISLDKLEIDETYKEKESAFVRDLKSNDVLLTYGKLFINDIEIPGFPPSKKRIEEIFKSLDIKANYSDLVAYYNAPEGHELNLDDLDFKTSHLSRSNCYDACLICTKYSRYISDENYHKTNWPKYEQEKSNHLEQSLINNQLIGYIEYHNNKPIGFIEGYSATIARQYGFVTCSEDACMITCLHIREEATGYGIANKLVYAFIEEAKKRGFKSVEVIAYQDDMNWQPIGFYRKMKFIEKRTIQNKVLMSLRL